MIRILWTLKQDTGPGGVGVRQYPGMAYDSSRGRTVLFAGLGNLGSRLNDTWEWDGENWTQVADTGGPPGPVYEHPMVYDAQRNKTVLYFGPDTWGWDGRNWTQLAAKGPSARSSHAMAYDSKRQRIVLFGGQATSLMADTWLWDGVAWTQAAATGPSARSGHAMAYDSTRDRTVLFGGFDGNATTSLGDTWEWNGSDWTQVSDFGPPPCALSALAFKGDGVALFGGGSGKTTNLSQAYGTTWTWDGRNWTLRQHFGPSPRFGANMCYDSKRGTLVLFGGLNGTSQGYFADTWEHSEGP